MIETFENSQWLLNNKKSEQKVESKCAAKETMVNCMFTAQGMFVCQKDVGMKDIPPNKEMANYGFQRLQKDIGKSAAPWS